jgi:multicomponent Na+:H+ antiporter subunit E
VLGISWKQLLIHSTLLSLLWLFLAGVDTTAWVVALPTVILALTVSLRLSQSHQQHLQWHLLPAFFFKLLFEMLRGGVQTSIVALIPNKRLRPGMVSIPLELSGTSSRTLLINILNLVPGTLSVMQNGDVLLVHVLDMRVDVAGDVLRLQRDVAAIFGDRGET